MAGGPGTFPLGVLAGGPGTWPLGLVAGGPFPLGECPPGLVAGGPFPLGVLAGGPLGVLDGVPAETVEEGPVGALEGDPGVLVAKPVPEDAAEGIGEVVAVGGGDTSEQNCATVSPFALAAAVSCGKLFWGLLEVPLLPVPSFAVAQAVHWLKVSALGADLAPFW
ncbi:MAG TPA: hypothetical protein VG014_09175, partial [Acidimicrobiales bacterium]|nr:hypothetical protein [Acidimicrobiales bacterium]